MKQAEQQLKDLKELSYDNYMKNGIQINKLIYAHQLMIAKIVLLQPPYLMEEKKKNKNVIWGTRA